MQEWSRHLSVGWNTKKINRRHLSSLFEMLFFHPWGHSGQIFAFTVSIESPQNIQPPSALMYLVPNTYVSFKTLRLTQFFIQKKFDNLTTHHLEAKCLLKLFPVLCTCQLKSQCNGYTWWLIFLLDEVGTPVSPRGPLVGQADSSSPSFPFGTVQGP